MGNPCKIPGILSVRIRLSLFLWAISWSYVADFFFSSVLLSERLEQAKLAHEL